MFSRLRARLRNRRFDDDLAEELRFHEEMKRQELEAGGLPRDDARSAARRALGNVTLMREDARRVWIAASLDSLWQDAHYAVRMLLRQPLHSLATIVILVFGIGLTTTMFTMFKAMMLDPWPVRDPGSVVRLWARTNGRPVGPSVNEFRFMKEHARSMSGLVAHTSIGLPARLELAGQPRASLPAAWVTADFFSVLGIPMLQGGGFIAEDDDPGQRRGALVISEVAWRVHFQRDANVIGRPVQVSGRPYTIVGVLPRWFDGVGREVHLWMPISDFDYGEDIRWNGPGAETCCISVVGRLAPGSDRQQARLELQLLHEQFTAARGRPHAAVLIRDTTELATGGRGLPLMGAFAAAIALVLLLACANVGNLQLARSMSRRREIATRMSIGASRWRVIRQLLTEGLVIALAAGGLAVALAAILPTLVFAAVDEEIPTYIATRLVPGPPVLVFTLVICGLAAVTVALAPALHATRVTIPLGLLDRAATRHTRFHLRGVLLATQVAASTALLAGAGVLTRAIVHAMHTDPGYPIAQVDVVSPVFPSGTPMTDRRAFVMRVRSTLTGPDLARVAVAEINPMDDTNFRMSIVPPHSAQSPPESVLLRRVSPEYFDVLGIPLLAGRLPVSGEASEIVVNESFVRAYWPNSDPLGHSLQQTTLSGRQLRGSFVIVGVVRDAHVAGFRDIEPVIFAPASSGLFLTRGGPAAVAQIEAIARGVDPTVRLTTRPLRASVRDALSESMIGAAFAWGLGLLGLVLATIGIFGVFAYSIEERRREIGVRLALGAARSHIVGMLVATSGRAMFGGLLLGLILSLACGPVLRRYLFGLSALDPFAYLGALALLLIAGTLATIVPARRACRIDPAVTLRAE